MIKIPNLLKEKINLKTITIQTFFETIDLITNGEVAGISFEEETNVIAFTSFGTVSGKIAYLSKREDAHFTSIEGIHKGFITSRNKRLEYLENDGIKEVEISSGFIPLIDVEIRYFNNSEPSKLDYFLLFADQVVGLSFGSLH